MSTPDIKDLINHFVIGDFFAKYSANKSENDDMILQLAKERNLIFEEKPEALKLVPNFYLADIVTSAIERVNALKEYDRLYGLTGNPAIIDPIITKIDTRSSNLTTLKSNNPKTLDQYRLLRTIMEEAKKDLSFKTT